jgi:lysophospholipase L1-like esterase
MNVAAGGPLVSEAEHVVVLGDSYSSGEGAAVTAPADHAYEAGACHRSRYTYAAQLFAGSDALVSNIACSGAVMNDYLERQSGRDVAPQRDQLQDLDDVDLVFLTIGGNDLNFSSIIKNCLLGSDCTANVATCAIEASSERGLCRDAIVSNPMLWQEQLGTLRPQLVEYYRTVLRDSADLGGDRGAPPLVVLPYVNVLPDSGLALGCTAGFPGLSQAEMALVRWLQDELNSQVAQAVAEVRRSDSRIYYADDVVHAVEPDHTLCGERPWINGIWARGARGPVEPDQQQELIHPNALGYQAEAAAILRWSRTVTEPEAGDVRDGRPLVYRIGGSLVDRGGDALDGAVDRAQELWHDVQEIDLDVPRVVPVLPGLPYRVIGAGFAPGETVVVSVASTPRALATAVADEDGVVTATVQVPENLPPGDHTLFATGFGPDGAVQVVARPVALSGPSPAGPLTLGAGALLALLSGALLLRGGLRRRRTGTELRRVPAGEHS